MTPELAQLLDGPVAERFGRPKLNGRDLVIYNTKEFMTEGPRSLHVQTGDVAAALWLAHLIGVFGEKRWAFAPMFRDINTGGGPAVWHVEIDTLTSVCETCCRKPDLLEALARAMMAIPG